MTKRLLVNPGTPQAWEIHLKPGTNRLGRAEHNDFKFDHGSVSSSHCEIVVSADGVLLKDLGSTNGTFVNRAQVTEILLQPGHHVQLGSVDMLFETDVTAAAATAPNPAVSQPALTLGKPGLSIARPATPASAAAASPAPAAGRLRLSMTSAPPPPAEAEPGVSDSEPPLAPPLPGSGALSVGAAFCKSHPKTPARFFCQKCQRYFCDLCISTRPTPSGTKQNCRACGSDVMPVQVNTARPTTTSFFAKLPGAFVYPFRGIGLLILICATIAFSALEFVSAGLFGIFIKIGLYGFLFLFMQNIIHTTTSDEKEPLGFPSAGDLFGAAFQLGGTILAAFGVAIGLLVARFFDVPIPGEAIITAVILGCFYFPMAFLAVAMKDSVMAANPLVVIPAILRIPGEYLVASLLLLGVFGIRKLGDELSGVAGDVSFSTRDMSVLFAAMGIQAIWAFFSMYLLTVSMRILGLLYNSKKHKFGWFRH